MFYVSLKVTISITQKPIIDTQKINRKEIKGEINKIRKEYSKMGRKKTRIYKTPRKQ